MKEMPTYYYEIQPAGNFDNYAFEKKGTLGKLSLINLFVGANNTGKSRFLRNIFNNEFMFNTNNFNATTYNNYLKKIKIDIKESSFIGRVRVNGAEFRGILDINYFDGCHEYKNEIFPPDMGEVKRLKSLLEELKKAYGLEDAKRPEDKINDAHNFAEKCLNELNIFEFEYKKRFYVPVLRGMRPLTSSFNDNLYENRTRVDYFDKDNPLNNVEGHAKVIFTGLDLFAILKDKLLGEPQDREAVYNFQEFLKEKFFNNKTITLIPREKDNVVHVKIGNDVQLPIYNLGDGLQNLIIITFNMFMEKEKCLFFLEEPELYMHPGFQRIFLEVLSSPQLNHHQYFITTHSNHLLDMTLDFENMSVFLFRKKGEGKEAKFLINQVSSRERNTLKELGVQNSSVFLSNATIWVEGITDRLYLRKYMDKFKKEIASSDKEYLEKIKNFKEDYHYSFVEYQGSNITHWTFDGEEQDKIDVNSLCAQCFLIADGDIEEKGTRKANLGIALGDRFEILKCKEIENLIPEEIVRVVAGNKLKGEKADLNLIKYEEYSKPNEPLGDYLNSKLKTDKFAEETGTIKNKGNFCEKTISLMDNTEWALTPELKAICKKIYDHIFEWNNVL
ncbi:MAG: AAA family ATPase [bacterium]|nr:AAA family ATPase [bacterium]